MAEAPTIEDIRKAHERIAGVVHPTPVLTCAAIDRITNCRVFMKAENLQGVGAFKFRGASNAVRSLSEGLASKGVCTHSSGNHAQALARAALERGVPAWIVMPTSAPRVKRMAVEGYGATVVDCEPTLQAREDTAAQVMEDTGATFIHPYDDARIVAGAATAAVELLEAVPDLDVIMAPVGGGGLMSGTCLAAAALAPAVRCIGVEPDGADDAARSLEAGEWIAQESPDTICDGLLTSLGKLNWPILRDHLETILTVSDDSVIEAMRLLMTRAKTVVEPSGATPLAALLARSGTIEPGTRVGLILSGGNVDPDSLPW
ncbi:MAG: pyridoxal-phosphate dependent enzyme [Phycisphaerales bacterium]|nr:pyridoxal-phosphate dependent enzyme [Phycisphaerales bacterium]